MFKCSKKFVHWSKAGKFTKKGLPFNFGAISKRIHSCNINLNICSLMKKCETYNEKKRLGVHENRRSPPELLFWEDALKTYSKFTGEHPCRKAISKKLQSNLMKWPLLTDRKLIFCMARLITKLFLYLQTQI